MKKILWLSTGGTISCVSTEKGLAPANSPEMMKKMTEELFGTDVPYEIVCRDIMNIDSTEITCNDIALIAKNAADAITEHAADGIVMTHGTDTMAYTAAMLYFMLKNPPVPVILTGSQLPFCSPDTDGKRNLKNAFAAASDCRFNGVYLLFGDNVIKGDRAYKACSKSFNAFISAEGYAAHIDEDGNFYDVNASISKGDFSFSGKIEEGVMLIKLSPNFNAEILDCAAKMGIKGIVCEGYGLGGIPRRVTDKLSALCRKGVRVIVISQCLFEGVSLDVYAVGRNAAECGIESGGSMTAECALAKLMTEI
ncbi:MAG: asparaginase [Huintestinicola sp.]